MVISVNMELIPMNFALVFGIATVIFIMILLFIKFHFGRISDLKSKAVLVTGCDSGFGHELAKKLDELGITVFAGCLFPEGDGAKALKNICSDRIHILPLDVTKEYQVNEAVKIITNSVGNKTFWGIVNNAGIMNITFLEWETVDSIQKVLDVNTLGSFRVTKKFLPLLRKSKGRIVFVASLAGKYIVPSMGAYCISKFGVIGMANVFRSELKQFGVSVHCIQPTAYRTPMTSEESVDRLLKDSWHNETDEIRSAYGMSTEDDMREIVRQVMAFSVPENKCYQVVNDIEDALFSRCPKKNYIPGLYGKLCSLVMMMGLFEYVLTKMISKAPRI